MTLIAALDDRLKDAICFCVLTTSVGNQTVSVLVPEESALKILLLLKGNNSISLLGIRAKQTHDSTLCVLPRRNSNANDTCPGLPQYRLTVAFVMTT